MYILYKSDFRKFINKFLDAIIHTRQVDIIHVMPFVYYKDTQNVWKFNLNYICYANITHSSLSSRHRVFNAPFR